MQTTTFSSHLHPSLEQLHRNTSLWIGHMKAGPADHFAGQTFQCPRNGDIKNIEVYPITVSHPGKMILTLHEFEKSAKNWGPTLTSSEIELDRSDEERWIRFSLPAIPLYKDKNYGFRLTSPNTLIAIGEAAWPSQSPFTYGEEWNSNNVENKEHYYRYFSLAFKLALKAA